MADIIRIVIKGASGYCCIDEAYNDKVAITSESISYEYVFAIETEINPERKWSYKANSPIFKMKFDRIAKMIPEIIERGIDEFCTDIGGIEFNIMYADKTKIVLTKILEPIRTVTMIGYHAPLHKECRSSHAKTPIITLRKEQK